MSLMVLGTVAIDNITTPHGSQTGLLGGSGCHFALSAQMFAPVHLVSVIGEDFPVEHMALLKRKGIDIQGVEVASGKSFRWDGEYDAADMNQALTKGTELGVLLTYKPRIPKNLINVPYVFLGNFDPSIQAYFLKQLNRTRLVGLDTMNLWIQHSLPALKKLIRSVDLFIVNDAEARALSGETNLIKAAQALEAMGPKFIVIKKGEHGVLFYSRRFMFGLPAYPVAGVVDPTGAGDTFAGGLMGYISSAGKVNEAVLRRACTYATVASSFNVEGFAHSRMKDMTRSRMDARARVFAKFAGINGFAKGDV